MINQKPKPCKGTGVAKGYGCGELSHYRKLGLSTSGCKCYYKWLYSTDEGQKIISKRAEMATKKRIEDEKREMNKQIKENKQKAQELRYGTASYHMIQLQPVINSIVKSIDYGQNCTAYNKPTSRPNAGHVTSVKSNNTIRFNLHNIFLQSAISNGSQNDDDLMREGVKGIFGEKYLEFVQSLRQTPPLKYSARDYIIFKERATKIDKELKQNLRLLSPKERIELRNNINKELGIYSDEQAVFNF